jgi:uncharacterized protein Veg
MKHLKSFEEKKDFFNTDNDDYLTSRYKKNDIKIRELKPQKGMWVNLNNEFGDVWHEIDRIYEPKDYYASVYVYDYVDTKSDKSKISSVYYHDIRKISETLPSDARVIMSKDGTKSPRRNN